MTATPADRALRVERLCCVRGDRELFRDLDFEIAAGDLVHLKGRNGSGKTTLLRALAGLLMPESGRILWHGESIRKLREDYARHLLFIGHLNGIKGDLTAVENLRISATLDGYPLDEPSAWRILGEIGLRGHEDLPTKYLSQGQKRRVSLARLFANSAALWILDEPFSALDVAAVDLLQDSISRHIAGGGMAVVTTHQAVGLIDDQTRVIELGRRDA